MTSFILRRKRVISIINDALCAVILGKATTWLRYFGAAIKKQLTMPVINYQTTDPTRIPLKLIWQNCISIKLTLASSVPCDFFRQQCFALFRHSQTFFCTLAAKRNANEKRERYKKRSKTRGREEDIESKRTIEAIEWEKENMTKRLGVKKSAHIKMSLGVKIGSKL